MIKATIRKFEQIREEARQLQFSLLPPPLPQCVREGYSDLQLALRNRDRYVAQSRRTGINDRAELPTLSDAEFEESMLARIRAAGH